MIHKMKVSVDYKGKTYDIEAHYNPGSTYSYWDPPELAFVEDFSFIDRTPKKEVERLYKDHAFLDAVDKACDDKYNDSVYDGEEDAPLYERDDEE